MNRNEKSLDLAQKKKLQKSQHLLYSTIPKEHS